MPGSPGSGFTLLFEALLLQFAAAMPVATTARMVGEHDTRIWRVLEHYVTVLRDGLDFSSVSRVGVDETSARKGHDYVSVFMDLDDPRVLFATEDRDSKTKMITIIYLIAGRPPLPPIHPI